MSTTVLEALENGFHNLLHGFPELGLEQIQNGITALRNGMSSSDVIQESLDSDVILEKAEDG